MLRIKEITFTDTGTPVIKREDDEKPIDGVGISLFRIPSDLIAEAEVIKYQPLEDKEFEYFLKNRNGKLGWQRR